MILGKGKIGLFAGDELEGQYAGYRTLFVQGDVPFKKIKEHFNIGAFEQIYFGAGGCSEINWSVVRKTLEFINKEECSIVVAAEVSAYDKMPSLLLYKYDRFNLIINLIMVQPSRGINLLDKVFYIGSFTNQIQLKIDTGKYVACIPLSA